MSDDEGTNTVADRNVNQVAQVGDFELKAASPEKPPRNRRDSLDLD
ncbi:MAG: hypothetical protein ACLQGP_35495 [Isosphaeraceae bacterium]